MASSLLQLLSQEGFEDGKNSSAHKTVKFSHNRALLPPAHDSVTLPIYICHDRRSFDSSKQRVEKTFLRTDSSLYSSKKAGSVSEKSVSKSIVSRIDEPAIDEVAIKAVVSILGGYVGKYIKDRRFREIMRDKCNLCLDGKKLESNSAIFAKLELGIESVDRLVDEEDRETTRKEHRMKTLRNSAELLTIVASLKSSKSFRNGFTGGIRNSHLLACAQLYLAIVYKLERNDRVSARHLLQVFCDSPYLARTHLLPDLWEHFFLPHLLHLKVWYNQEIETLSNFEYVDKERRTKSLSKLYNNHVDRGTIQFALYYKQWLKVGSKAPLIPTIALPTLPRYANGVSRSKSSDSYQSHSSLNKNLFKAVFGQSFEGQSMDIVDRNISFNTVRDKDEEDILFDRGNSDGANCVYGRDKTNRRLSSIDFKCPTSDLFPDALKPDYFQVFTCQTLQKESLSNLNFVSKYNYVRKDGKTSLLSDNLGGAISTICSSDILSDCETAIREVTKAWLNSHGDPIVEAALSKAPIIEGMLEVLYASNDDEILELVTSILAELVAKNEVTRWIILNADPQLGVFLRLLKSSSLFLKASVLLYLSKPKAKQMISVEWVPLILRVLEFGDQLQTLFTVKCSPHVAAFYLLDQLLRGFDEDRNLENGKQLIALGGLNLLLRRMEKGDMHERKNAAMIILRCIQADGSCRNYLAETLMKPSLIELIIYESKAKSNRCAIALLAELLCLSRSSSIKRFIDGLREGWSGLNLLNTLLVYQQNAPPDEHPLTAAIILKLDLMGDPVKCSMYREEAIDTIIMSLDCQSCNEKVQKQSARALSILGGQFSVTGESSLENWLLRRAGFGESFDYFTQSNEEEEEAQSWQYTAACVLLNTGKRRFVAALSTSMASGNGALARASLVAVSWISSFICSTKDENFRYVLGSILVPWLLVYLNYDKEVEERVLASYALLHLLRCSADLISTILPSDDGLFEQLRNLSLVTWTASELLSIMMNRSKEHIRIQR